MFDFGIRRGALLLCAWMACGASASDFGVQSRDSTILLTLANLGHKPGYDGGGVDPTEVMETGQTSADDMLASGLLFYGPDGFDRVNTGSYFLFQDVTIEEAHLGFDLTQQASVSGEANPGAFSYNELEIVFQPSTPLDAVLTVQYDGTTNLGRDEVGLELRELLPDGSVGSPLFVLSTAAAGMGDSGSVSASVSLLASQRYRLLARGEAEAVVLAEIESFVRGSLAIRCAADLTTEGANPGDAAYAVPDGSVTVTDLTYFAERWIMNDQAVADLTTDGTNPGDAGYEEPDGSVTVTELTYFVERWIAGCA
ncbi:MAG: GC-type dockerin domain-anchored protein [Planctomycetota bacterium]